jgi:hypothetical protein
MKRLLIVFFLTLILYSCSPSLNSIFKFDYPLTQQRAYSKTTNISVKLPDGWFTAEDNEYKCIDLWLVSNDYKQSLNFSLVHVDEATRKNILQNGIERLATFSKISVKARMGKSFKGFFNEEVFELNGKRFSAYEYENEDGIINRVVLFEHKNNFYELTSISKESGNYEQLRVIQNTVLTSLN